MSGGLQVWLDGILVPADAARVSVYDRGFRSGEGVFETLRAYGAHPFRLAAHLQRARAGAAELGFDPGSEPALADAVTRTAAANLPALGGADSALRLTVSAGRIDAESPFPGTPVGPATVVVTSHPLRARSTAGATAVTVALARELPHVKSVSYLVAMTARRRARAAGAEEAVLISADGHVLEGSASNVFAVRDGALLTPPLSAGVLAGVTRQVVLEVASRLGITLVEQPLALTTLLAADEAFLTATTREVFPLLMVDGRPIALGRPGPVTARIQAGYRAEVELEIRRLSGGAPR